ncbi:hypothetical protein CEUSTIGMA_g436.t1 [Chlamydomonas eustigma]|uniref:serine C-palmitoyltransferase n=1 Tax=Chlamydomonas eustigma TaxID=1157962 RepID=A0A250WQ59_9CHLO|nr:hypothetical protein CEUSTIGMA_g436.t1 [Chlamydomonas eustigma]|eukprot:GAX72984.1 hypothetical protein CEUSTIGMA_g436.t1 [Chlamydomonas eustigma]
MSVGHDPANPPFLATLGTLLLLTTVYVLGKLRELFSSSGRKKSRQGYAPIREKEEDFYDRRVFSRIKDCWNRPIASAPGAWIDVLERDAKQFNSNFHRSLQFTGSVKRCLNLGSYNYLGFAAADEYCTPRVQSTLKDLGVSMCSSRSDSGTTSLHLDLEREVATFVGKPEAVVFGMGYVTNSAVIPVLAGKGCLLISDALNHASIVVGARASGAKVKVFRHNDAEHLEDVLRASISQGQPRTHRPWKKIIIIVEGIYSMEGESCCLKEIVEVKKKYKAYLYLDEAHSIGALGKTGRGCCEHWGVDPADVDIMMGTFTKSFGSCGGYIAGSPELINYLRRHGPAHLYAASISPAAAQQILSAIKLINGEDGSTRGIDKVKQLHDNANYFRCRLLQMGLHVLGDWNSPVMPIMIYHSGKLPIFSRLCLANNVATVVVGFPATSVLLVRARVCISASHSREDLEYALEVIKDAADKCLLRYRGPKEAAEQVKLLLSSAAVHSSEADAKVTVDVTGKKRAAETDDGFYLFEEKVKESPQKNGKVMNGVVTQKNGKVMNGVVTQKNGKSHKKGHFIPSGAL